MKFQLQRLSAALVLGFASVALVAAPPDHKEDFEIAIDAKTGQLVVLFDEKALPFALPDSKFPLLPGFALDDPGFVSLDEKKAREKGLLPLDASAFIALEVLNTSSSAMRVWDPLGPGEDGFEITGKRFWELGAPFFDAHPYWHIDSTDPDYKPGEVYELTFRLLDLRGKSGHGSSGALTVAFVPEPTALVLLLIGALGALRRCEGDQ